MSNPKHIIPATDLKPGDAFRFVEDGPRFGDTVFFVERTEPMHDGQRNCLTVDFRSPTRRVVETFASDDKVIVGFTNHRTKHRRRNMKRAQRFRLREQAEREATG